MSQQLDDFKKIFKEWELGVRSMVYQHHKGGRTAAFEREAKKFEEGLTARLDAAWRKLPPFDQETFVRDREAERRQRVKARA